MVDILILTDGKLGRGTLNDLKRVSILMDKCQNGYFREDFEILLKVTDFENLTLKKCCSIFLFFANETF